MKSNHKIERIFLIQRISISFIILAILLLLYPIIANHFADQKRSQAVSHYDQTVSQLSRTEIKRELEEARRYNKWLYERQIGVAHPLRAVNYDQLLDRSPVLGTLDIPAIDIRHMPFFHGSDQTVLEQGLGHIRNTSLPIGGKNTHAVITGHSGVSNQKLFSDINKLRHGDVFYITILHKNLMYRIKKIQKVKPSETDKLRIEPGKDKVTLLTCTPPGINTERLLVTGYREKPFVEASKEKVTKRNFWNYEHLVMLLILILLFLLLAGYLVKRKKNLRGNQK